MLCALHGLLPRPLPQHQKPSGEEETPADSVRDISVSTLYLVSTTVDRMSDVSVHPPCD